MPADPKKSSGDGPIKGNQMGTEFRKVNTPGIGIKHLHHFRSSTLYYVISYDSGIRPAEIQLVGTEAPPQDPVPAGS